MIDKIYFIGTYPPLFLWAPSCQGRDWTASHHPHSAKCSPVVRSWNPKPARSKLTKQTQAQPESLGSLRPESSSLFSLNFAAITNMSWTHWRQRKLVDYNRSIVPNKHKQREVAFRVRARGEGEQAREASFVENAHRSERRKTWVLAENSDHKRSQKEGQNKLRQCHLKIQQISMQRLTMKSDLLESW